MSKVKQQLIEIPVAVGQMPNLQDYLSMSTAADIGAFCQPLSQLAVDFFVYIKRWHDGTFLHLTNNSEWMHDFFDRRLYQYCIYHQKQPIDYLKKQLWSDCALQDPVKNHLNDHFGINNVLTYCEQYENCHEFYIFGSSRNTAEVLNTYINNFDVVQRFILCFKNKYYKSMEKDLTKRIVLPSFTNQQFGLRRQMNDAVSNHHFTHLKRYYLNEQSIDTYLTNREFAALQCYIEGKTVEQISAVLAISPRTVESHLIKIKEKTNCYGRAQLIAKFAGLLHSSLCP